MPAPRTRRPLHAGVIATALLSAVLVCTPLAAYADSSEEVSATAAAVGNPGAVASDLASPPATPAAVDAAQPTAFESDAPESDSPASEAPASDAPGATAPEPEEPASNAPESTAPASGPTVSTVSAPDAPVSPAPESDVPAPDALAPDAPPAASNDGAAALAAPDTAASTAEADGGNGAAAAPVAGSVAPAEVPTAPAAPVITSGPMPAAIVGHAYSFRFTADQSVTWAVTGLPSWLTLDPQGGLVSGTPATESTYSLFVTATNADGRQTGAGFFLTVDSDIRIITGPTITSGSMPTAWVGEPYSYAFTADQPVTWALTGLPAGLSFDAAHGVVSGTPTAAGHSTLFVTATAADGSQTGQGEYLAVDTRIVIGDPISFTFSQLAEGTIGAPYSFPLTADEPATWTISGLPEGLTLISGATGTTISGTATVSGAFDVTITATAANGSQAATSQTITILPAVPPAGAPQITSPKLSDGTVAVPYSFQVTASNSPKAFKASGLPDGLVMNLHTGLISGTPTMPGSYAVTVYVVGSTGVTDIQDSTVVISPPPAFTSAALPDGIVGVPYSFQLKASGDVGAFGCPVLPAGLAVDSNSGVISGTPTTMQAVEVKCIVYNTAGAVTDVHLGVVRIAAPVPAPPTLTLGTVPPATVGQPFSYTPTVSSETPAIFSLIGSVPGLTLNTSTGELSGTPTAAGTYTLSLTVRNKSDVSAMGSFTVTVGKAASTPTPTPTPTATPPTPGDTPTPTDAPAASGAAPAGSAASPVSGSTSSGPTSSGPTSSGSAGSVSRGSTHTGYGPTDHGADNSSELAETGQTYEPIVLGGALAAVLLVSGIATVIMRRARRETKKN